MIVENINFVVLWNIKIILILVIVVLFKLCRHKNSLESVLVQTVFIDNCRYYHHEIWDKLQWCDVICESFNAPHSRSHRVFKMFIKVSRNLNFKSVLFKKIES